MSSDSHWLEMFEGVGALLEDASLESRGVSWVASESEDTMLLEGASRQGWRFASDPLLTLRVRPDPLG